VTPTPDPPWDAPTPAPATRTTPPGSGREGPPGPADARRSAAPGGHDGPPRTWLTPTGRTRVALAPRRAEPLSRPSQLGEAVDRALDAARRLERDR
jgi:hypothetical protein